MRKKGYPISIAIVLASLSFTMPAMAQKVPGFSDNVSVDQMQTSLNGSVPRRSGQSFGTM